MVYQTTVQSSSSIRFGSAKIEIGLTTGSLVDFGIAQNIEFSEAVSTISVKPDNAPEIPLGIKDHSANVKFDLMEVNLTNLNALRGFDTYGTVAASPVGVTNEAITLTGTTGVRLAHKNGAGTQVTISSIKDSSGTTAAQNTDYIVYIDSAGYTCIARVSASTVITDGELCTANYTYTPSASKNLSSGGLKTITTNVVRLTNTNSAGAKFEITIYKATNQKGISLKLPSDDSADPMKSTIELQGYIDATRTAGDQLFKIVDEQNV